MSGIYVKGVEMPDCCSHCICAVGYDIPIRCDAVPAVPKLVAEFDEAVKNGVRAEWCPLIPVTGHGRLGDLDELEGRIKAWMLNNRRAMTDEVEPYVRAVLRGIQATPSVIQADGE